MTSWVSTLSGPRYHLAMMFRIFVPSIRFPFLSFVDVAGWLGSFVCEMSSPFLFVAFLLSEELEGWSGEFKEEAFVDGDEVEQQ